MEEPKGKREAMVGLFVLLGLIFLVSGILVIGNLSGTFKRKMSVITVFNDVGGLQKGNNVWFSGVKIGTINDLQFYSLSKVKVVMKIEEKASPYIRKNAIVKLSSEGLIGNKILIIEGGTTRAPLIVEGDTLRAQESLSTEQMMNTLQGNNENLLSITNDFREISQKLMNGEGTIGKLLTDETLYENLTSTSRYLQNASAEAAQLMASLTKFSEGLNREGTLVKDLTTDTTVFKSIKTSVEQLEKISDSATVMINNLKDAARNMNTPVGVLLHDEESGALLKETLKNLESGSKKLDEDLEALQHNFLFRGYFKKKEKERKNAEERK